MIKRLFNALWVVTFVFGIVFFLSLIPSAGFGDFWPAYALISATPLIAVAIGNYIIRPDDFD